MADRIVGIYIRLPPAELERLREHTESLASYDVRAALAEGRAYDIGRAWEELAVFIDGGFRIPEHGPTIGEHALPCSDVTATWSCVLPDRVVEMARDLSRFDDDSFRQKYDVDPEETQDTLTSARTGAWGDRAAYMYNKLIALAAHYRAAAERGEGMLVRIGAAL